jgi:signal transduction histidine kinase
MGLSRPRVTDAFVALLAFGLTLGVLAGARGSHRGLDALGVVLAAAASLPLLAHRGHPLEVFVVTAAASAAINGLDYAAGPPFGPTFALFFVALDERTRDRLGRTAAVVLTMFAVHLGATAIGSNGFPTTPILFGVVVWGGAWVIGDQVRQRRQRVADLVERARRSEQERERERRLAAAEERTRIARDLHDSAAHAINVILVQAGAARLLQRRDPEAAQTALSTIEEVARETVTEIDQLVTALREDGRADGIEPPTGLAALETLLDRHRSAGLAVEARIVGERRLLPPALDQAAYRILQESLTNAARHGTGEAELEVVYGPDRLELTVRNPIANGAPGGAAASGHGILGMRERAGLLDGALEAGTAGGSFGVHASLPYTSRSAD